MKIKWFCGVITLLYSVNMARADVVVQKDVADVAKSVVTSNHEKYNFCPDISAFELDAQHYHWSTADGNWKSYGLSFAKKLTAFIGAQWDGVNIGQLTCLYAGVPKGTFVIKAVSSHLFYAPTKANDNHWSTPQDGFINCKSHEQKQCPVRPVYKKKKVDLIEQAESLKQSAGSIAPKEYAF